MLCWYYWKIALDIRKLPCKAGRYPVNSDHWKVLGRNSAVVVIQGLVLRIGASWHTLDLTPAKRPPCFMRDISLRHLNFNIKTQRFSLKSLFYLRRTSRDHFDLYSQALYNHTFAGEKIYLYKKYLDTIFHIS